LFGLLIGSFLNVCIYRWPRDLSVVRPRSHCPDCEKTIFWYDNIPLLSFALLRGKCRYCSARISWRYPVVELLTAAAFFYFIATLGLTAAGLKMCVFAALLVGLIFADLEELILPDEMTLGGILVPMPEGLPTFLLIIGAHAEVSGRVQWLTEAAFGAALPAFFLWFGGWAYEKWRHREGLGFGDVKLIAMIGAFLGLNGALFSLMFGSVAGSVLGYGYIKLTGKDPSGYELPYGTFLGAAALIVAMAARRLLG
jgi:leader peptidase (prepilin peptidase)/N-methyltransferase